MAEKAFQRPRAGSGRGEAAARPRAAVHRAATGADRSPDAQQPGIGNAALPRMLGRARDQHGAGGGPPDRAVLARQPGIGNAALARMLGQARHAPAAVQRSVHDVLRAPGQPLSAAVKKEMEARLGADFSDVRVHTDSAARASAAGLGARAYTSGSHVVIGGGADKHTLAHELTHVLQRRQGPVAGTDNGAGLSVSDPSGHFERAAEANAIRAMTTQPARRTPEQIQPGPPHTTDRVQRADDGQGLLAHEPVHAIQQGEDQPSPSVQRLSIESPASPAEDEARVIAQTSGTPALPKEPAHVTPPVASVQRQIDVGEESYTMDDAREFRRTLMLKLKDAGYKETITKKMAGPLDEALSGPANLPPFGNWDDLISSLVEEGLLDKELSSSGRRQGPRRLGERPRWGTETAKLIKQARGTRKGLAARHVLASSTLGLAVERAQANLDQLNAWLVARGQPREESDSKARRAIWTAVHNFAGNIWMGETQANTAIGFIRGVLAQIKQHLPAPASSAAAVSMSTSTSTIGPDLIDIEGTRKLIEKSMVTGGQDNIRNRTWNLLLTDLSLELAELGPTAPRTEVVDLIDMYYRNADIDPPALTDGEYWHVVNVYEMLKEPTTALDGLTLFMGRPLSQSIGSKPTPTSVPPTAAA